MGTSLGVGTQHLALGNPDCQIVSVDACSETQKIAREYAEQNKIDNVEFVTSDFLSYFQQLENKTFDLVFVDGHHDGKALEEYLRILDQFTHDETVFILDDIRWSDGMFATWKKLLENERFHLTMDLFRIGIVLKRTHQHKENFTIKMQGVLKGM